MSLWTGRYHDYVYKTYVARGLSVFKRLVTSCRRLRDAKWNPCGLRPAKFLRLDWDSCQCVDALDRSISDSEPLTLFTERSWKSLLHAAALRKDRTTVFLPRREWCMTCLCLVECIIASATSRTLTRGNWTSWQCDSLRKLQADDEQDHDDGEQLSISISLSDVKRSLQGSQGKHSPVCSNFRRCAEQIPSRRLVVLHVAKYRQDLGRLVLVLSTGS